MHQQFAWDGAAPMVQTFGSSRLRPADTQKCSPPCFTQQLVDFILLVFAAVVLADAFQFLKVYEATMTAFFGSGELGIFERKGLGTFRHLVPLVFDSLSSFAVKTMTIYGKRLPSVSSSWQAPTMLTSYANADRTFPTWEDHTTLTLTCRSASTLRPVCRQTQTSRWKHRQTNHHHHRRQRQVHHQYLPTGWTRQDRDLVHHVVLPRLRLDQTLLGQDQALATRRASGSARRRRQELPTQRVRQTRPQRPPQQPNRQPT